MNNIKRYIRLYALSAKMDLAWLLRDTRYAVVGIVADVISNLARVAGIFLLAVRFGGIGGMNEDDVLFMLAHYTVVTGMFFTFLGYNIGHISRIIGRGQLEHMLIQPLPVHTQMLTMGFMPVSGFSNIAVGVGALCIAIRRMGIAVTFPWICALVFSLLVSILTFTMISYLCSTAAFYAPVAAEEISMYTINSMSQMASIPLSGTPYILQVVLVTIIPAGLQNWFPALALVDKTPLGLPAYYPFIFLLILSGITLALFRKGFDYYVKKGSNRYSSFGHRR